MKLTESEFEQLHAQKWQVPPPAVHVSRPWWLRAWDRICAMDGYRVATWFALLILAGMLGAHLGTWAHLP